MPRLPIALASAVLILAGLPALAQESVAITGVRMQAFLERSGRWSDDLAAQKKPFKNLPQAGSDLGEPANAVLVTLVFSGPKNGEGSRSIARDMAQVSVKQSAGDVPKTLLYRAFGGLSFGADGQAYKAFLLDDATCAPLEVDVKVGRTRKVQTLDLSCEAPATAQADPTKTGATKGKPEKTR
ncbi:MAG TPA: hypothetical protein VHL98_11800 [Microvirga sp.]|jgi:hypothetical protein|nr:hypothetical protein [Microvirga sp.]